jgi:[pyruvate, water dikinase]-phosphate phosphotransferase / [pyruvate, water dikinase] kinase
MSARRTVFFVSDSTGITAETLGQSILTHFPEFQFERVLLPFVDSEGKMADAVAKINAAADSAQARPLVFSTLVDDALRNQLTACRAMLLDCFETFVAPLEAELGTQATQSVGRSQGGGSVKEYDRRMEAVNYTLSHDDGVTARDLQEAEIILLGVSRSGKTPTCLYMAMQFGIKAANYPLIPEDMERMKLPSALGPHTKKLFGLTIRPERLHQIRSERRPGSTYAALSNCKLEVQAAEALLRAAGVPCLESTSKSIEELATTIMHEAKLQRHVF